MNNNAQIKYLITVCFPKHGSFMHEKFDSENFSQNLRFWSEKIL